MYLDYQSKLSTDKTDLNSTKPLLESDLPFTAHLMHQEYQLITEQKEGIPLSQIMIVIHVVISYLNRCILNEHLIYNLIIMIR